MNYQHDFHAGNFADVFKHIVLSCILSRLCAKPAAFRYIDTHAASGIYDLFGSEAGKTAEWHGGIGRFLAAKATAELQGALACWRETRHGKVLGEQAMYAGAGYSQILKW